MRAYEIPQNACKSRSEAGENIISASTPDFASALPMNTRQNLREELREYRQESSDAILPLEVLEVPKLKFKALATLHNGFFFWDAKQRWIRKSL